MIVTPPLEVDDDVISSSTIPYPDNSQDEVSWRGVFPVLNQSLQTSNGFGFSSMSYDYYHDGSFVAVDGTSTYVNKLVKRQSSDLITDNEQLVDLGVAYDVMGYGGGIFVTAILDDNNVKAYDDEGNLIHSIGLTLGSDIKGICFIDAGVFAVCFAFSGSYYINAYYFDKNVNELVYSEAAPSPLNTGGIKSASSDGVNLYLVGLANSNIYVFDAFDLTMPSSATITGSFNEIAFDRLWNRVSYYASSETRYINADYSTGYGKYNQGDVFVLNGYKFRCLVSETLRSPLDTTDWELIGGSIIDGAWNYTNAQKANKYAAFDSSVNRQSLTVAGIDWDYTFNFGQAYDSIGLFNIAGDSITVTMTDGTAGVVYANTITLNSTSYADTDEVYIYSEVSGKKSLALFGLPDYPDADLDITITGSGACGVGEVVIGNSLTLGVSTYGTSARLIDYSRVTVDDFGNTSITKRGNVKRVNYKVKTDTGDMQRVYGVLSDLTTQPCMWSGLTDNDPTGGFTLLYGIYEDAQPDITSPSKSDLILTVRGLT